MRKIKFLSILLVLSMLLTVPAFAFSLDFTDVPENAVYAESVSYLADAGKRTRKEQQPRILCGVLRVLVFQQHAGAGAAQGADAGNICVF